MRFLPEITGFCILGFALWAQLRLRPYLLKHRSGIALCAGALVALSTMVVAFLQYNAWSIDPVSKFLLPPYHGIGYFVWYVAKKLFVPWTIAAVAGFLGMLAARRMNARYGERFFEEEEPFLFGLAIFGAGYPTLFLYIVILFLIGIFLTVWYTMRNKGRAPLYYLWLSVALFAILSKSLLLNKWFWAYFNF